MAVDTHNWLKCEVIGMTYLSMLPFGHFEVFDNVKQIAVVGPFARFANFRFSSF